MKSKFFFAAFVCCMGLGFATEASANSWRVHSDKRAKATFLDLNAAMADSRVAYGDTLYMDKGCTISSEQTITKKVTVVGPGYFIGENDADEAYFSNSIYIDADSVKLTGLHTSAINIRANAAVIERCRVTGNITAKEQYENDGAQIRSCFLTGNIQGQGVNGSDEWNILNNIFYVTKRDSCIIKMDNALIDHNTFNLQYYDYQPLAISDNVSNSVITNNIFYQGYSKSNPVRCTNQDLQNTITNNVSNYNFSSNYPDNLIITDLKLTALFRAVGSDDSYYNRVSYSDVDTYGTSGSACGVTGGAYPYVLHGYPMFMPRIESFTVEKLNEEMYEYGIRVNMVIKSQNK